MIRWDLTEKLGIQREHVKCLDKVAVECDVCKVIVHVNMFSYKKNISKNIIYKCFKCSCGKQMNKRVILTCANCSKIFDIIRGRYYRAKKHAIVSFCRMSCKNEYQSKQFMEARKKGKRCSRCHRLLSVDNFSKAAAGKKVQRHNKLYQYCHKCKNEYRMIYNNRIKMRAIKYLGGICIDCNVSVGKIHPVGFDFHHRTGKKDFNISRTGISWSRVKEELDKCVLLCAPCHRVRHINKKLWEDYDSVELID